MKAAGSGRNPRDMISYKKSDILRIISVPVAAGHRGQFTFSDF